MEKGEQVQVELIFRRLGSFRCCNYISPVDVCHIDKAFLELLWRFFCDYVIPSGFLESEAYLVRQMNF